MKKILFTSLIAACAAIGLSGCMNGAYDANPDGVANGTNPLNPPGGGGGGNPSSPSYYSWSGSDPLSAKIDGTGYTATNASANDISGNILVQATGDGKTFTVTFPSSATNGSVHIISSSSVTTMGYTEGTDLYASGFGSGGGVYIEENDATHVKGKFFANVKTMSGSSKNITDGYFNITK